MELFRSTQLFMPSSSETRVQKCLHKLKGTRCWTYIFGLPSGRPLHSYLSLLRQGSKALDSFLTRQPKSAWAVDQHRTQAKREYLLEDDSPKPPTNRRAPESGHCA